LPVSRKSISGKSGFLCATVSSAALVDCDIVTALGGSRGASWLSRIGAYIWWEISAPELSEPSRSWIRLVGILRSGYRIMFRAGLSHNIKRCHGRKTWCSDPPIQSHNQTEVISPSFEGSDKIINARRLSFAPDSNGWNTGEYDTRSEQGSSEGNGLWLYTLRDSKFLGKKFSEHAKTQSLTRIT
jgi:hypothetical protein